jgi:general secretion pathway protein L
VRETLYIRLRDTSADSATEHAITSTDPTLGVMVRSAPLAQLGAVAKGRRVVVFIPGAEVRLLKVTVPARQAAKVLQAAPYLVEDQFADDVELLHFALGPRQADGTFPLAAIARERIEQWLSLLRGCGIVPNVIAPDTLALPWPADGTWQVLAEPTQITVRTDAFAGFTAVPDDFEAMLQLADPGETPHPLRILITQDVGTDFTRLSRPVELRPGYVQPIEALARNFQPNQAIDLLQGEFTVRQSWQRYWQPWRAAAGLAAALFALTVIANVAYAIRTNRLASAQETANVQRFQALFPSEAANPALLSEQLAGLLKRGQGHDANALFLLVQNFAEAQAATPGLTLKTMQFHDGALFLDLTGSDLQVLEKMRNWFSAHPGVHLDVQSADSGASGVQIRLKLSLAS